MERSKLGSTIMLWVTLTDTNGDKIEVNLGQVATMQVMNNQTTIVFAFTGHSDRPYPVYVKETPDQIYQAAGRIRSM